MIWNSNDILSIFRIGIEAGLIDCESVIKWADAKIMDSKECKADYLIDLSMAGSNGINEVLRVLNINDSKSKEELVWQTLYGLTAIKLENQEIDLERACYVVTEVANKTRSETEYDLFGMSIDDSFYLASRGITGNLNSTKRLLIEHTAPYVDLAKAFISKELKK